MFSSVLLALHLEMLRWVLVQHLDNLDCRYCSSLCFLLCPAAGPGTCFFTLCRASFLHFCSVWACLVKMAAVVQCGDDENLKKSSLLKNNWLAASSQEKFASCVINVPEKPTGPAAVLGSCFLAPACFFLIGWSKIWLDLARRLKTTQSAHCNRLKCIRVLPVSSDSFLLNKLLYLFSFSQSVARNRNRLSASLTLQYSLASSV